MRRIDFAPYGAAVLLAGLVLFAPAGRAGAEPAAPVDPTAVRTVEGTFPAAQVTTVSVEAGDGSLQVVPGPEDTIRVRVDLATKTTYEPRRWFRTRRGEERARQRGDEARRTAELRFEPQAGGVRIRLEPDGQDVVEERWVLELPARLALRVKMDAGRAEVRDIAGGLDVNIRDGSLKADVSGGDISARFNHGQVDVKTRTRSYGNVDLRSEVGSTSLSLGGHRVVHDEEPGPGSRVALAGEGDDSISLHVQVGEVQLRID